MQRDNKDSSFPHFETKEGWALFLSKKGFTVLPGVAGTKKPACRWETWEQNQSEGHIHLHWGANPHDEICIITGDRFCVLDADTPESENALLALEEKHGIYPSAAVKTRNGLHHYFRVPEGVIVKKESFHSAEHPEKLDVRTGRALVAAPCSPGKVILKWDFNHLDDLAPITQDLVDDVAQLNGLPPPSVPVVRAEYNGPRGDVDMGALERLVNAIPAEGYIPWTNIGMAIHFETCGSSAGLQLYDKWSATGSKYVGTVAIKKKWDGFHADVAEPRTIGTIRGLAKQHGADVAELMEPFSKVETEVVFSSGVTREDLPKFPPPPSKGPRMIRHSLTHRMDEVERLVMGEVLICGGLVAMGETTLISAEPNTGKTVLMVRLLIDSIRDGSLDPTKLIYLNLDDTSRGLYDKLKLAAEYGFEMLAPGFGFKTSDTLPYMEEMMIDGTAHGCVVVVDTVTRLFDNNSKTETRAFTDVSRRFTGQGGTLILLGHCNKHRNKSGKLDYAGVSDLPNDVDCRYILDKMEADKAGQFKVVGFENGKRRSSVKQSAAYKYSTRQSQSYEDLLLSIQEVNAEDYFYQMADDAPSESQVVAVVREILTKAPTTRMKLAMEVGEKVDLSRTKILAVMEKYGGADPSTHYWTVTKRKDLNNAFIYELREQEETEAAAPVSRFSGSPAPRPAAHPAQTEPTINHEEEEDLDLVAF